MAPVELHPRQDPLIVAAASGQTAKIEEELDRGKGANSRDAEYGRPLLSWAAQGGHEDAVRLLLRRNADVNAVDLQNRTPLSQAAADGHVNVARDLLAAKARPECRDSSGCTPLILASKSGSFLIVKSLVEAGVDLDVQEWCHDRSALSWAAERGYDSIVEILLKANAGVNLTDKLRRTPLSLAAMNGCTTAARLLLQWKADTKITDIEFNRTPFLWAIKQRHDSVVQLLKSCSPPEIGYGLITRPEPRSSSRLDELQRLFTAVTPDFDWRKFQGGDLLQWAVRKGRKEDARFILDEGADPNWQDEDGMTALAHAASTGLMELVECLLKNDVDPEPVDNSGRTPLAWAAEAGHNEIARLLIERNVNLDIVDDAEMTPLLLATIGGHELIVSALLDGGADINAEDENGQSALCIAVEQSHDTLVTILIERGALTDEGLEYSPLMVAVANDDIAMARRLLEKGADPYSASYNIVEAPPLVLAASHGNEAMMNLFLGKDAASNEVKNEHIWEALVEASTEGQDNAVKLLLEQGTFHEGDDLDDMPIYMAKLWGHKRVIALLKVYYPDYDMD